MNSSVPNLKLLPAKQALVHFFQNDYWTNEEIIVAAVLADAFTENISAGELEQRSGSSHTTVQNYIHRFQEKFYQSISA